jgi:hypothetical protein
MAAVVLPTPPAGLVAPNPPLPPPATPHTFSRVILPGRNNQLDYVAVRADATVVKGLPALGWVDSSATRASTKAVPLLQLAGAVCLPAFLGDPTTPTVATMLALSEITLVPALALVQRCADACDSLGMFAVPISRTDVWIAKLTPALARAPSPSPFEIRAGELMEANPFEVAAVAAVAAVPAIPRVPAVRARGARAAGGARAAIPAIPHSIHPPL